MDTNLAMTNIVENLPLGCAHSEIVNIFYNPPKAIVQLALVAIVGWAFRHVVHWLGDRLKQGNGAPITVMLCMSLMWVYGFLETSIQHGIAGGEKSQDWSCNPLIFACMGSVFMLISMWIYIKSKNKDDEPPKT